MPSVTVVPGDRLIIVDGVPIIFESPFPILPHGPGEMRALQWNGTSGEIEWEDDYNWPLEPEAYEEEVAPYVALWQAEKQRRDELKADQEAEANTLPNVKARKLQEIVSTVDTALLPLSQEYPYKEQLSFQRQEKEARALLEDPFASAPLLTSIAAGRGISATELANKVIARADAYTAAIGAVIGESQKDKDRLDAAQSVEDVAAIVPAYKLPEVR